MSHPPRRSVVWLSLLSLTAILCTDAKSFGQYGRQSVLPTARELNRLGLETAWWSQATINVGVDKLVYLSADEDAVVAQSRSGIVTAFDAETGRRLWSRLLGRPDAPSYPAVSNSNQVLVATGMNLFALDKLTGRLMWQLNLPHHPSTTPAIDDTQAYIGTLDGSAYAFDLATIRELYEDQRLPEWSNVAVSWRYQTGAEVTSPPISTGLNVSFASLDGSVYAISRGDGSLTFQFETNGAVRSPLGRSHDALFLASDDVRFFCIDVDTGRLRWTFVPGLPIRKQPRIVGNSVFVAPERGGMYSLSEENGLINWHQVRASSFVAASDQRVYGRDNLGNLLIISPSDGAIVSTLRLQQMQLHLGNDRTDRLFFASESGVVMALKEIGSEFPKYHKFPERQPILPPMGPDPEEAAANFEPPVAEDDPADSQP